MVKHARETSGQKPLLKWVGGKTQIMDTLMTHFPTSMHHYHEPFVGGGSVLLGLLTRVQTGAINLEGKVFACDANEPLIHFYKNIQTRPEEVWDALQHLLDEFRACGDGEVNRTPQTIEDAMQSKENYYYWTRSAYNSLPHDTKNEPIGSAMFLFLNKTCFRGVFRMGPRGFNVPYGHYKNPEIANLDHWMQVHRLIQPVVFECCDFHTALSRVEPGDFVYLDPPYAPETATSFVGYTEQGFSLERHHELFEHIHSMTVAGVHCLMSNADVSLVRDHFRTSSYAIDSIVCKRAIHSKNPDATAREVLVHNKKGR